MCKKKLIQSFYLQWECTSSISRFSFWYSRFCILWLHDKLMMMINISIHEENVDLFVKNWYWDIICLMTYEVTNAINCWKMSFRHSIENLILFSFHAIRWLCIWFLNIKLMLSIIVLRSSVDVFKWRLNWACSISLRKLIVVSKCKTWLIYVLTKQRRWSRM
jgi:hypothetical protein